MALALDSYRLSMNSNPKTPREKMLKEKRLQVEALYNLAADREDSATLNGKPFVMSPRIFGHSRYDTIHHRIEVETIHQDDRFECGDYLQYEGENWLCMNSHVFHGLYCKGLFQKCNTVLRWQDKETLKIHERPAFMSNATKYGTGEDSGKLMTIPSAQHVVQVCCDDDTILIDTPLRLMLDKNRKRPSVYRVTQNDNTTPNYGSKGICNITVLQDALRVDVDNIELGICDYVAPVEDDESPILFEILGRKTLKIGCPRTYTAKGSDDSSLTWAIRESLDGINLVGDGTKATLTVYDENLIGESLTLQLYSQDSLVAETVLTIESIY